MVAQAVGLGAAVDYLVNLGMQEVAEHELAMTEYSLKAITDLPGVRIIGPLDARNRGSAISFVVDGIHPHDVGQVLTIWGSPSGLVTIVPGQPAAGLRYLLRPGFHLIFTTTFEILMRLPRALSRRSVSSRWHREP